VEPAEEGQAKRNRVDKKKEGNIRYGTGAIASPPLEK